MRVLLPATGSASGIIITHVGSRQAEALFRSPWLCTELHVHVLYWSYWSALETLPVKSFRTPTHSRVFLYLDYFLQCRIIVKSSKL